MFINPILQSAFLFSTTGSWDLFAIKSAAVFGLAFFQVNGPDYMSRQISRESSVQIRTSGTTEMDHQADVREFADFNSLSAAVALLERNSFCTEEITESNPISAGIQGNYTIHVYNTLVPYVPSKSLLLRK